jgi:ABC-type lipoprotein release transport system permease subunit
MSTYIKLAWRNIWRNRRRTLITTASIFLAIFLALIMRSMQLGSYASMIDNIVRSYTGYIQVHKKGYWDEKDINNSFPLSDSLLKRVNGTRHVAIAVPRLESFALASSGPKTKGVLVVGINPEEENKLSSLKDLMYKGSYLSPTDSGALLSKRLAEYLGLKVGDTLVLIGQGYHGVSAAGKFPVRGILKFKSPDLDKQMIYLSLNEAQYFYSAENNITSLTVTPDNKDKIGRAAASLKKTLNPDVFEVMTWNEMLVELVQYISVDNMSGLIMIGILYVIIGFGIFGTILMMTLERIREFGVMVSVGMQKTRLAIIVILETIFIGLTGIIAGFIVSTPLIVWFYYHPIPLTGAMGQSTEAYGYEAMIFFEPPAMYFLNNGILVMILVLIAAIYPVRKIFRLNIINALHNKI